MPTYCREDWMEHWTKWVEVMVDPKKSAHVMKAVLQMKKIEGA